MIGLDYCHQKGVVQRDIKLNNMLVQVCIGL
jgi:serine/threonine protein kinase